jgi:hypothetical protein
MSPFGLEVPEGKYFNPYAHHMIIGMPRVRSLFKYFSNYMTECLSLMMEPLHRRLKWRLMWRHFWISLKMLTIQTPK